MEKHKTEKQTLFKHKAVGIPLLILAALFVTLSIFSRNNNERKDDELNMPRDYIYGTAVAANSMELHYLRTRPSNVKLESVHNNVTAAPFYGINGGFFYQDALLSIVVENDLPVNEAEGQYGAGEANAKYARGTLVWDGSLDRLNVQVMS